MLKHTRNVTVLLGYSFFNWTQKHLCRPSGYGAYWLFVPYSRVLRYRALQPSSVRREEYTNRNLPTWDLEWYWTRVCGQTCFLCILRVKNVRRNIIGQLSKKKQYITQLPHPLPSLQWVAALSNMTTGSSQTTQIVYAVTFSFFVRFVWNCHTIFYTHTVLF